MDNLQEFGKFVEALRPWHNQIVIVGGWAHRLHRYHSKANPPDYLPVTTKDADAAFSHDKPPEGDIRAALVDAGFKMELRSDLTPPVTHFRLGEENKGFYGEFLVPLFGGLVGRNGKPVPLTVEISGLTAQKLRYLDILLAEPWSVVIGSEQGFDLTRQAQISVPNPVSFIAQKLLIKEKREPGKQAQDALYIHDTLDLFGAKLDELGALWSHVVRPRLEVATANKIGRLYREQYENLNDVHRNAVRIPQDRSIGPTDFQRACLFGLQRVFGAAESSNE